MVRWTLAFCLVAAASGFGVSVQQRRPLLPAQRQPYASVRVVRMQAELAAVPDEPAPVGLKARVAAMMPPKKEMQKLVPLASMFFCILFSYTILRDTKDVLVRHTTLPAPALHRLGDAMMHGWRDDALSYPALPARFALPAVPLTLSLTLAPSPGRWSPRRAARPRSSLSSRRGSTCPAPSS